MFNTLDRDLDLTLDWDVALLLNWNFNITVHNLGLNLWHLDLDNLFNMTVLNVWDLLEDLNHLDPADLNFAFLDLLDGDVDDTLLGLDLRNFLDAFLVLDLGHLDNPLNVLDTCNLDLTLLLDQHRDVANDLLGLDLWNFDNTLLILDLWNLDNLLLDLWNGTLHNLGLHDRLGHHRLGHHWLSKHLLGCEWHRVDGSHQWGTGVEVVEGKAHL